MSLLAPPQPALIPGPTITQFSFGQRAAIVLFRGAGGLLGSSPGSSNSGLDALNTQLQNRFSDYYFVSRVLASFEGSIANFSEVGSEQGAAFLERFAPTAPLGIVGYSAGGLSAIRLAKNQAPRPVDLLVQLDTFDPLTGSSPEDEVLPGNVLKGINYYQNANRFNPFEADFDPTDLQGARNVEGSQNIDAEAFVSDRSLTHRTLDDSSRLQTEILSDIEEFVLQDLQFDGTGQLALGGNHQLVNNLLVLRSTANQPTAPALIREPINLNPDFSFSTRFEFRLSANNTSELPGFSFWVQPEPLTTEDPPRSPLAITFHPDSPTASQFQENAVAVVTPTLSPGLLSQAIAPLDLDSGDPLTAWVNYDGPTDQLAVFLSDTLTQPRTPLITTAVDLYAIAGPQAQFGFQAAIDDQPRQAEILTWQLRTNANDLVPPTTIPDSYLNLGLTQRTANAFLGLDLPFQPFAVRGLDFSTFFDEAYYLRLNPDVLNGVLNGVHTTGYEHFTEYGWLEGRAPSSLYDEAFYLAHNPDVAQAVQAGVRPSGFEHFVRYGHIEGRDPSARFDPDAYLLANPDVANGIAQGNQLSAFEHYVEYGAAEARAPQLLLFQEGYYLTQYPDVAAGVAAGNHVDGFDHYLSYGCAEGRNPSPFFNEARYLELNPDVAIAVGDGNWPCGWAHYLIYGRFEGRSL